MNDRYTTEAPRPATNPHDIALAVFRPEVYMEAADWLAETNPGLYRQNPGFRVAVDKLRARAAEVKTAPSAGLLDHVSAAYTRANAVSLRRAGYDGAARLLEHVADDYDGGPLSHINQNRNNR